MIKVVSKQADLIMYDVSLSIALYIIIVVFVTMSRKITMRTLNELDETNNQLIEINDSVMAGKKQLMRKINTQKVIQREWQSTAGKSRREWASRRKNRMRYTG